MHEYDKSSKWLIQHHGDGVMPEVIVLVLRPRGGRRIPRSIELQGPRRRTVLHLRWHTVELASIPARDLLDASDVGVVPWVTLAHIDGPPEPIFRLCKERIDREASPAEKENLFTVSMVLASLRYNDPGLLKLLGGHAAMIESPFLQELKEQWTREVRLEATRKATHSVQVKLITKVLVARFGEGAKPLGNRLAKIDDEAKLDTLVNLAATCSTLKEFRDELGPASPRRKSK